MESNNIVVIGFGWASIGFIQNIDTSKYNVTLISKTDHFLYTPLLAQNIKQNRKLTIHTKQLNKKFYFKKENVKDINFNNNMVNKNKYNYLILSHGAEVNTFNIPGVQENTYYLKTLEDSLKIKNKLNTLPKDSIIAVIGCGLAGTELIGTLGDMDKFNIFAIDALERPLITFNENLSQKVINNWKYQNINMHFKSFVQKINHKSLEIKDKKHIKFDMAIWCGGIKMSQLSKNINIKLNLSNKYGIPVDKYLNVINQKNIFAIGDCAYSGYPPTAQVAYQQGVYLANRFNNLFKNKDEFNFKDKGQIGYIGNKKSVYQNNYFNRTGKLMYYVNNFIHLYNFGKIYIKSKF